MLTFLVLVLAFIGIVALYEIRHVRHSTHQQSLTLKGAIDAVLWFTPEQIKEARQALQVAEANQESAGKRFQEAKKAGPLSIDDEIQWHRTMSRAEYDRAEAEQLLAFFLENNGAVFLGRKTVATMQREFASFSTGERLFPLHAREHVFELVLRRSLTSVAVSDLLPGHIVIFACSACSSEQQVKARQLVGEARREATTCQTCGHPNEVTRFRSFAGHNPFVDDLAVFYEPPNPALEPTART